MSMSGRFLKGVIEWDCLFGYCGVLFTSGLMIQATLHLYSGISSFLAQATTEELTILEGGEEIAIR